MLTTFFTPLPYPTPRDQAIHCGKTKSDRSAAAQAFTDHYYRTFDTNRPALASLYEEQSLLTFEVRHQGIMHPSSRLQCTHFIVLILQVRSAAFALTTAGIF